MTGAGYAAQETIILLVCRSSREASRRQYARTCYEASTRTASTGPDARISRHCIGIGLTWFSATIGALLFSPRAALASGSVGGTFTAPSVLEVLAVNPA